MKIKILTLFLFIVICSCSSPYNEEDAKTLIRSRGNYVNVSLVYGPDKTYKVYAAVDSTYNIHVFGVNYLGQVEELKAKVKK